MLIPSAVVKRGAKRSHTVGVRAWSRKQGLAPLWVLGLAAACSGTVDPELSTSDSAPVRDEHAVDEQKTGDGDAVPPETNDTTGPGVSEPDVDNLDCTRPNVGSSPLRRLSNAEYANSVSDLFPEVAGIEELVRQAVAEFPAEPESLGFRNSAELLSVQSLLAQKYMDAAESIAAAVAQSPKALPCNAEGDAQLECVRAFVSDLGERVYRRPLKEEEAARYEAIFEQAQGEHGLEAGVEWVVFTMLQSPQFLYRVEGATGSIDETVTRLSPHEMATRLAYLFWQSTPDLEVLRSADATKLDTPEEVEALAREMLADPRADRLFQFFVEWLDLDRLADFDRDPEVFGDLPPELPNWLEQETKTFVHELLGRPDGGFEELLTAPFTYVNAGLAEHYGLASPETDAFVRVDDPERSGILTQALLLSHDKPYRTSIVGRGLKVRTDLLCQNVPSPPDDVPLDLGSQGSSQTQRERLEQHRADPACASCHVLLDPIGIALENFDAVGRYRDQDEAGKALETSSELTATLDANGTIASARDLGARLAQSKQARDCYVTQTFRFFFGRDVETADACSIRRMQQAFNDSDHSLSELLISLTQTDAFLYRLSEEDQP